MKNYFVSYYWEDHYGDTGFGHDEIEIKDKFSVDCLSDTIRKNENFKSVAILFFKEIKK